MTEHEFILEDRIAKIQSIIKQEGEERFYLSFSGGKDSTVLHYLLDEAIPNNTIPRVFINTGIEYNMIVDYVKELKKNDNRILILDVKKNIKKTLEEVGYPFKSKEHSLKVGEYQKGSRSKSVLNYMQGKSSFSCPKKLLYQFEEDFSIKLSDKCCYEFKKKPFAQYQSESGKTIVLTGMRKEEGGRRANISCIVSDKAGNIKKFHPLAVISEQWEEWFIEKFNIKLCDLYYEPYNFKRTGCKGCPYSLDLQEQLEKMYLYLPNEAKQCELIWKPIYDEYRRINYRLKRNIQLSWGFYDGRSKTKEN
jgi:3'-phosphoadenosine 5'-phosphosulfate sulfotransferase (PAPS reductase)/FAD synthetase